MDIFDLNSYMAEMVFEYVPNVKRVGSNKLNFRCPICGDGKQSTKHRGWFYIDTGSYYCWNAGCPANSNGMSGLRFLSIVSGKTINEVRADLINKAGSFEKVINRKQNKDTKCILNIFNDDGGGKNLKRYIIDKIDLGEWQEDLPLFVTKYITNRKLLKAPFLPNDFKFYYDKKLKRLVIPWTDDYYQERTILKSQWKEDKYKFPFEVEKPIFGLENLDKSFKYIFLVEGVFDSIWVKNGVAVGSLTLSSHQKDILKKYEKDYKIVFMPDNQFSDRSSYEKTSKLCKEQPFESIFIWPKQLSKFKDVNETIIKSDKFIEAWKSEKFLVQNISNGISALMKLNA